MKLAHILVCHSVNPTKAIESIPHTDAAIWYVFLHSENEEIEAAVDCLMGPRNGNVFPYKTNRGLARSWNEGLHLAMEANCDAALLLNDDLLFFEGAYVEFCETLKALRNISRDVAYATCHGLESGNSPWFGKTEPQGFSCCAIMRECVAKIGYFDETFWPAYCEDMDFYNRVRMAGMGIHVDPRCLVEHERSSTRSRLSSTEAKCLDEALRRNAAYYESKWGTSEKAYVSPFADPDLGPEISFSSRRKPYGNNILAAVHNKNLAEG